MEQAKTFKKAIIGAALAAMTATASAEGTPVNMFDGDWHFNVTPYGFLPQINQSVSLTGRNGDQVNASVSLNPGDWWDSLNMTFMIYAEARKGDWSVFTDYMYSDFGALKSRAGGRGIIDADARLDLTMNMWTTAGSYTAWREGASHLDAFGGFRYLSLEDSLSYNVTANVPGVGAIPLRNGKASGKDTYWDFIGGVKGVVSLDSEGKWFLPYYADIGVGSNNWTWQALIGAGYRFNNWGAVTLMVRNVSYNFDEHDSSMRLTGPQIGLSFLF